MRTAVAITLVVAVLLAVPMLFVSKELEPPAGPEHLPWQIETLPEGRSRVFGLVLGSATLDEARSRLGGEFKVAIVAAGNEVGALEAYNDSVRFGFITGRLILTMDASESALAAMRERSPKSEYMESASAARKFLLSAADLDAAGRLPIAALAFIPSANLDEQTVIQRFGPPAERIRTSDKIQHFLYPDRGLDILLDADRKELLQYVAPSRFARLRDPLLAAAQPKG